MPKDEIGSSVRGSTSRSGNAGIAKTKAVPKLSEVGHSQEAKPPAVTACSSFHDRCRGTPRPKVVVRSKDEIKVASQRLYEESAQRERALKEKREEIQKQLAAKDPAPLVLPKEAIEDLLTRLAEAKKFETEEEGPSHDDVKPVPLMRSENYLQDLYERLSQAKAAPKPDDVVVGNDEVYLPPELAQSYLEEVFDRLSGPKKPMEPDNYEGGVRNEESAPKIVMHPKDIEETVNRLHTTTTGHTRDGVLASELSNADVGGGMIGEDGVLSLSRVWMKMPQRQMDEIVERLAQPKEVFVDENARDDDAPKKRLSKGELDDMLDRLYTKPAATLRSRSAVAVVKSDDSLDYGDAGEPPAGPRKTRHSHITESRSNPDFLERMGAHHTLSQLRKASLVEQSEREFTFQPVINERSRKLSDARHANHAWMELKELRLQQARQRATAKAPKQAVKKLQPSELAASVDRLYSQASRYEKHKDQLREHSLEFQGCSFRPAINRQPSKSNMGEGAKVSNTSATKSATARSMTAATTSFSLRGRASQVRQNASDVLNRSRSASPPRNAVAPAGLELGPPSTGIFLKRHAPPVSPARGRCTLHSDGFSPAVRSSSTPPPGAVTKATPSVSNPGSRLYALDAERAKKNKQELARQKAKAKEEELRQGRPSINKRSASLHREGSVGERLYAISLKKQQGQTEPEKSELGEDESAVARDEKPATTPLGSPKPSRIPLKPTPGKSPQKASRKPVEDLKRALSEIRYDLSRNTDVEAVLQWIEDIKDREDACSRRTETLRLRETAVQRREVAVEETEENQAEREKMLLDGEEEYAKAMRYARELEQDARHREQSNVEISQELDKRDDEITSREKEYLLRDSELSVREKEISEQCAQIEAKMKTIQEESAKLEVSSDAMRQMEEQLRARMDEAKNVSEKLSIRENALREREEDMAVAMNQVEKRAEALVERSQNLERREGALETEKQRISKLASNQNTDAGLELEVLRGELDATTRALHMLREETTKWEGCRAAVVRTKDVLEALKRENDIPSQLHDTVSQLAAELCALPNAPNASGLNVVVADDVDRMSPVRSADDPNKTSSGLRDCVKQLTEALDTAEKQWAGADPSDTQLSELYSKAARLDEEVESLQTKLQESARNVSLLRSEKVTLQEDLSVASRRYTQLQDRAKALEKTCEQAERERDAAREKVGVLERERDVARARVGALEKEVDVARFELQELRTVREDLEALRKTSCAGGSRTDSGGPSECVPQDQQPGAGERATDGSRRRVAPEQHHCRDTKASDSVCNNGHRGSNESVSASATSFEDVAADIDSQMERLRDECTDVRGSIAPSENHLSEARRGLPMLSPTRMLAIAEARAELLLAQTRVKDLEAKMNEAEYSKRAAEATVSSVQTRMEDATTTLEEYEEVFQRFKAALQEKEDELQVLRNTLSESENETRALQTQKKTLTAKVKRLGEIRDAQMEAVEGSLHRMQEHLLQSEKRLKSCERERDDIDKRLRECDRERDELRRQVASMQANSLEDASANPVRGQLTATDQKLREALHTLAEKDRTIARIERALQEAWASKPTTPDAAHSTTATVVSTNSVGSPDDKAMARALERARAREKQLLVLRDTLTEQVEALTKEVHRLEETAKASTQLKQAAVRHMEEGVVANERSLSQHDAELRDRERKLLKTQEQHAQVTTALRLREDELSALRSLLKEREMELRRQEDKSHSLLNQISDLEAALSKKVHAIELLEKRVSDLQALGDANEVKATRAKEAAARADELRLASSRRVEDIQHKAIEEARAAEARHAQSLKALREHHAADIKRVEDALRSEVQRLLSELEKAREAAHRSRSTHEATRAGERVVAEKTVGELRDAVDRANRAAEAWKSHYEDVSLREGEKDAQLRALQEEVDRLKSSHDVSVSEPHVLEQRISDLQQSLSAKEAEVVRLRAEINSQAESHNRAQSEARTAKKEAECLKSELQFAAAARARAESDARAAAREATDAVGRVEAYTAEVTRLKAQIARQAAEIRSLSAVTRAYSKETPSVVRDLSVSFSPIRKPSRPSVPTPSGLHRAYAQPDATNHGKNSTDSSPSFDAPTHRHVSHVGKYEGWISSPTSGSPARYPP
eukprot:Rmarinus@m.6542